MALDANEMLLDAARYIENEKPAWAQAAREAVAAARNGWRPIETAPRDGTRIIVYRPKFDGDYIPQVGWDFWMTKGLLEPTWGKSRKDVPPTHWMPFPEPPR